MASFSAIAQKARKIAQGSDSSEVGELAKLITDLARECDDLESKVRQATQTADQALTEVRSR
jgi:hypothetical protein